MIDIALLSCNRPRLVAKSIVEIKRRTTTPYRLIVLDNGSHPETVENLTSLYEAGFIDLLMLNNENTGVHWGFNTLLRMVETNPFVCTDGDIIPSGERFYSYSNDYFGLDWLGALRDIFIRHRDEYAAIACRPHVMIGANVNTMFRDAPEVVERSHAGAVLRMMDTARVRQVGGWKWEKNPSRNNEEWFIGGELREAGYKVGYARDLHAIHLFGKEKYNEDPWGYPLEHYPEPGLHGHNPISPPVNHFSWDNLNIDWETCKPRN